MTGLNTKTIGIQESLDLMNTKLDTIITLLGGTPPTPTATLDDLLAELVLIRDNTADIHIDTMSMDGKLLAIRNYILNPTEEPLEDDYTSLLYNIMWIRRAIAAPTFEEALDYRMQVELHAFNFNNDVLISTTNNLINILQDTLVHALTNLGVQSGASPSYVYQGWLAQVLNWLGRLSGASGLPIDAGNRNIIELLAKIADRPESNIGSGLEPSEICPDAYLSTGMQLVPGLSDPLWPSLIYAIFGDPPPSGVEYGSVFGIGVDYTELDPDAGTWTGWWIYVASSADNYGRYVGTGSANSLIRYPTNTWLSLDGYTANLSVFVPGEASVRVYLCTGGWAPSSSSGGPWSPEPEEPPPPLDGFEITSQSTTYQNDSPFSSSTQGILWGGITGLSAADTMTSNGPPPLTEGLTDGDGVVTTNLSGWTVKLIAGVPDVVVIWVDPDGDRDFDMLGVINDSVVLPATQGVLICYPATNGSGTPFTIEMIEPV